MKDAIKLLNQMIFLYAAVYFVTGIYGGEEKMPVYGLWIVVLVMCCYLIRLRAGQLSLFLAGHVILTAVGIAFVYFMHLSGGFSAVLLLVETVFVLMRLLPVTDWLEEPGYFHLGAVAAEYLFHWYLNRSQGALNCALGAFVAILLLKVIYGNLKEADEFVRNRASSTKIDEAKFRRLNDRITFCYSGALGLILLATAMNRDNRLFSVLFGGLARLIRSVLGRLENLPEELQETDTAGGAVSMSGLPSAEQLQASPWGKVFDALAGIVTAVIGAALVILIAVALVKALNRLFYTRQEGRQEAVDYVEPLTTKERIPRAKRRSVFEAFEQNPAKRIRRSYRRTLRRMRFSDRLRCMSPSEQMEAFAKERGLTAQTREEITGIYEKARYANEAVSEAEAKRMMELLKFDFSRK